VRLFIQLQMVLCTIWKTSDFFVLNYVRLACLLVSRVFYFTT